MLPRCGAALGACVSLCAWCTCTRVIRSVQSSWVCVCVCVHAHLCVCAAVLVYESVQEGRRKKTTRTKCDRVGK